MCDAQVHLEGDKRKPSAGRLAAAAGGVQLRRVGGRLEPGTSHRRARSGSAAAVDHLPFAVIRLPLACHSSAIRLPFIVQATCRLRSTWRASTCPTLCSCYCALTWLCCLLPQATCRSTWPARTCLHRTALQQHTHLVVLLAVLLPQATCRLRSTWRARTCLTFCSCNCTLTLSVFACSHQCRPCAG